MIHNLRRKVTLAAASVTALLGLGAATAAPASATTPVISSAASCSDGHTLLTVTIEPVPGHAVSAWNTWGAIITQGTALPSEVGKLGLGSHLLHVQVIADTGGFTKDYTLVVNPLPDCETPTSEETVATTAVDTVPVTNATTEATEPPTVPPVASTAATEAPAVVDTTSTSTTAVAVAVSDDSDTQADQAVAAGSQLPRTGGTVADIQIGPFDVGTYLVLLLLVGLKLLLIGRKRHVLLPATVRVR